MMAAKMKVWSSHIINSHEINFSSDYAFPPESAFVFKQRQSNHYAQT